MTFEVNSNFSSSSGKKEEERESVVVMPSGRGNK